MTDTITIQRTSKKIKGHLIASLFTLWVGFMLCASDSQFLNVMGGAVVACGFLWFFAAKIARWWNHA